MVICLSIGLPGRFSAWCDAAVAALLERDAGIEAIPPLAQMLSYDPPAATLDEIARALIRTATRHLVVGVRHPGEPLRRALAENGARFVIGLDHPRRALADLLDETGADPNRAVRAVANCCATVMRFPPLPGALLLHADTVRSEPREAIAAIGRHLGLAATDRDLDGIADRLSQNWNYRSDPEDWAERIPAAAQRTMRGAFAGYEECFAGRGLGQIIWGRDLFIANDPQRRAREALDLPGGPRVLISGPYIHLPPGRWTAQAQLGITPEAAGCRLIAEVFAGTQLAAVTLQPTCGGLFAADLHFSLDEPSATGLEIRVAVADDDAKGRLALSHVVLRPLGMAQPDGGTEWREEVRALLGL